MDQRYAYKESKNGRGIILEDRISLYQLFLGVINSPGREIHFRIPSINEDAEHPQVTVTNRDYNEYIKELGKLRLSPSLQYIEIGAGLGGFIPELIRIYGKRLKKKPIVIDPVNYDNLFQMLIFTSETNLVNTLQKRVIKLLERCKIYMGESKVQLLNLNLHDAMEQYPEIRGSGDVVIDLNGASYWGYDSTPFNKLKKKSIDSLIKALKKR